MRKEARIWLFRLIAVMIPLVILVLAELLLKIIGFGSDLPVFIHSTTNPAYLLLNPEVSKRYFTQEENATKGYDDEFLAEKKDKTFRIFVQGESSAVGFPYLFNGSFPRMVKYRLEREFPEMNIEIINLGLTAVSSYTLADFGRAILRQKPDAILIYAGHNEYVGALGVGSTNRIGANPFIVKAGIHIRRLRLTQFFVSVVKKMKPAHRNNDSETLMQRMALKQGIPYHSKEYYKGIRQFNKNMSQLLNLYRKHNIPVFIADLISNEKDLKPFMSIARIPENQKRFEEIIKEGERKLSLGLMDDVEKLAREIIREDSLYADAFYLLGKVYYQQGKSDEAAFMFRKAIDLDQLRFRAPSEINMCIHRLAQQYAAVLIPFHETAQRNCALGIIGSEIVTEHVHPNLKGYSLLADLFHDALLKSKILPEANYQPFENDSFYKEMPLLRMDTLIGMFNLMRLRKGWPFYQDDSAKFDTDQDTQYKLALSVVAGGMNWMSAMDTLYREAVRTNNHALALRVAEGLHLQFPYDPRFALIAGGHALSVDQNKKAGFYFSKAFTIMPTTETAQKALICYLKEDLPEKALTYISYIMRESPAGGDFLAMRSLIENIIELKTELRKNPEDTLLLLRIAQNYIRMGNFKPAQKYLQMVLSRNQWNLDARNMLLELSRTNK